jgi:RND family efflux transporter MFP subunit
MSEPDSSRSAHTDPPVQLRVVPADTSASSQWQRLRDAGNEAAFASAWLALQCGRIVGVAAGQLVVSPADTGARRLSVTWPAELDGGDLLPLAERALAERRVIVTSGRVGPDTRPARPVMLIVAAPLGTAKEPVAAAAIAVTTAGKPAANPQRIVEELGWGAGWLEMLPWARRSRELSSDVSRAASCLDLLVTVGAHPRLQGMAIAAANELATLLRCDRVSIGVVAPNGATRLRALSHSASFRRATRLVDAIEDAMDEAIEQRRSVAHPLLPSMERVATVAHRALAQAASAPASSALSVVLADSRGALVGALTFERHRPGPFTDEAVQLAEAVAALLGPQLGLRLRANRLVAGRISDAIADGYRALFGPRRPGLKLGAIAAVGLALTLGFAQGEHRVTAKALLEPGLQRAAAAPFDGYVREAPVRAGDRVRAGDLLAALDDRDLVLDRLKWRAERDKLVQRQREALAKRDRTGLVVLESQIHQAEAQLSLAEEKLARARIVAPFDGIIVSGDLHQMLGSPVEKGKALFEIAPLDSWRLIVQVDERDVRHIAVGQGGTVALAARPGEKLPIDLRKITPVTVAAEGRNAFRVEARLLGNSGHLRPGMEGVAKIEAGRRSILWIWMHPLVDWLRLATWKYLP